MKLGTVIAFCAGAAVVVVGQRLVVDGGGTPGASLVSTRGTSEALALLQSHEPAERSPVQRPAPVEETAEPVDRSAPAVVPDATPPGATPPVSEESSAPPSSQPQIAPNPAAESATEPKLDSGLTGLALPPVAAKVADDVSLHPSFEPKSTDVPLTAPPLSAPQLSAPQITSPQSTAPQSAAPQIAAPQFATPQFAGAPSLELPAAEPPRAADPPSVEPQTDASQSTALKTKVDAVRDVGTRVESVLQHEASPDRSALTFGPPVSAADAPAAAQAPPVEPNPFRIAVKPQQPPSDRAEPATSPPADQSAPRTQAAPQPARAAQPAIVRNAPSVPSAGESAVASDAVSAEELAALKIKIQRVLDRNRDRMLNTRDHGAWEIMHSFVGYGIPKQVQIGGPGGRRVNAIGWLAFNGPSAGERLFTVGSQGPKGRLGPGLQGHEAQFLAMLAQSRVDPNYPMKVDGHDYTVEDLVKQEQATCRAGTELTFKLIGLMHYLKSDDTWQDEAGGTWDLPRLVKEELSQPIIGATCGGTHRLFGLSYAYKKRQQRGEPVTGQYRRAQIYVKDFQEYTFKMQNPDGSFSTAFFAGRGALPDLQRRLETTGHIAEWLTFSLDEKQVRQRRMYNAINYLATLLDENPDMPWKVGPLGHGLHALNLYDSAVLGGTAYPWPMPPSSQTAASAAQ